MIKHACIRHLITVACLHIPVINIFSNNEIFYLASLTSILNVLEHRRGKRKKNIFFFFFSPSSNFNDQIVFLFGKSLIYKALEPQI